MATKCTPTFQALETRDRLSVPFSNEAAPTPVPEARGEATVVRTDGIRAVLVMAFPSTEQLRFHTVYTISIYA